MIANADLKFNCVQDLKHMDACHKIFMWDEVRQSYVSLLEKTTDSFQNDSENSLRIIVQTEVSIKDNGHIIFLQEIYIYRHGDNNVLEEVIVLKFDMVFLRFVNIIRLRQL